MSSHSESSTLLPSTKEPSPALSGTVGGIIISVQVAFAIYLIFFMNGYGPSTDYTTQEYIIFRDIMVMLLLGFGFLMTFLEKFGLGAVGFTMLLTALNMELNIMVEGFLTGGYKEGMTMGTIIDAEFSAATLLITYGAMIGRLSPVQMCGIAVAEAFFYALNKVHVVFGILNAEDVGGTLTIHMFGAFFGLAASYALGPQNKVSASNNSASRVSDVFAFIGTTLLWVYWPSFVGATETGVPQNEMYCLTNTILALIGSTGAAFYFSQLLCDGKFDAVHIQNSTLAGGVAVGASARLAMTPGGAFLVGIVAGAVSVYGYVFSTPFLESKFGIYDTCGVANLHGYPSVVGGLASILFVYMTPDAPFLVYDVWTQSFYQLLGVLATLFMSIVSGYFTGKVLLSDVGLFADYEDAMYWNKLHTI